jgi:enamine deaminase RidA (YjgF/YER057c/UK114 family)
VTTLIAQRQRDRQTWEPAEAAGPTGRQAGLAGAFTLDGKPPSNARFAANECGQCELPCLVAAGWQASAMEIRYLQPGGLVRSPAFSHGAVIPPGATTIYIGGQNGVDETGQVVASHDAAAQAVQAVDNVETVLRAAGATLADVVAWTVLIAADADVAAAYGAIAPRLARAGAPPLVTAARVTGLAVPGALLEISAIAAVTAD